jgi:hypothetical protein
MPISAPSSKHVRVSRSLFEDGKLRCPHDKQLHDILSFNRFDLSREFQDELNVIIKCSFCGHIFSPALNSHEMKEIEDGIRV